MMINRLGGVEAPRNVENSQKPKQVPKVGKGDSIDVSNEAKMLSEVYFAMEAVKSAPDIREDRVAEVAAKLQNPDYINDAIRGIVADRVMDTLGL